MDENKLYKSLIICVLVLASLSLCTFIPRISVFRFQLKGIDLFKDIRSDDHKSEPNHHLQPDQPSVVDITYLPYLNGFTRYLTASDGISALMALPSFAIANEVNEIRLVYRFKDDKTVSLKSINELLHGSAFLKDYSPEG